MQNRKFIFTQGSKYIAVDSNNGQPYTTDYYLNVKTWNSIDEANSYYNHFKHNQEWQLRELHGLDMSLPLGVLYE